MQLSSHFTLEEATFSSTAKRLFLINSPPTSVITTMLQSARALEAVREVLAKPMHVDSWYRCPALNKAVGSKDTSQHRVGEAIDFICPEYGTPLDICRAIIKNAETIKFDQLILEHNWVHISFAILSGNPRGQVLSLLNSGSYASGLTDAKGIPYK